MTGLGPRGETLSNRQLSQFILAAPRIHYPKLSVRVRSRGTGLYEMRIDLGTGKVKEVVILKSAGARLLDIACLRDLGRWRFKPGTVSAVRMPVTFKLTGRATAPVIDTL